MIHLNLFTKMTELSKGMECVHSQLSTCLVAGKDLKENGVFKMCITTMFFLGQLLHSFDFLLIAVSNILFNFGPIILSSYVASNNHNRDCYLNEGCSGEVSGSISYKNIFSRYL